MYIVLITFVSDIINLQGLYDLRIVQYDDYVKTSML